MNNNSRKFNLFVLLMVVVGSASIAIYYSHPEMIGDINATMYYDEPVCDSAEGYETHYELCDKEYDELEEEDEKEHEEWAKENDGEEDDDE